MRSIQLVCQIRVNKFSWVFIILILLGIGMPVNVHSENGSSKKENSGVSVVDQTNVALVGANTEQVGSLQKELVEDRVRLTAENKGLELEKQGRLEEAIAEYKKAIDLSKYKFDALLSHQGLARIYEKTEKYQFALAELEWLINYCPECPNKNPEMEARRTKEHIEALLKQNPS